MHTKPRQVLCELYEKHGSEIVDNRGRFEGLLRDLCGEYETEIFLLVIAQSEQIPDALLKGKSSTPWEVLLSQFAKRMQDKYLILEHGAKWAVESWALAIGVIREEDVREIIETTTVGDILTREQVEEMLNRGEKNFVGMDLSNLDLSEINFEGVQFERASLEYSDLTNANLKNAILKDAVLRGADLIGANLESANLKYADFVYADLSNADLTSAEMAQACFAGANLSGANLTYADVEWTDFWTANLENSIGYGKMKNNVFARLDGVTLPDGSEYTD